MSETAWISKMNNRGQNLIFYFSSLHNIAGRHDLPRRGVIKRLYRKLGETKKRLFLQKYMCYLFRTSELPEPSYIYMKG